MRNLLSTRLTFAGRFHHVPFPLSSPGGTFEQFPDVAALRPPPPPPPLEPPLLLPEHPGQMEQCGQLQHSLVQPPQPSPSAAAAMGEFWFYPGEGHEHHNHHSDVNEG